MMKHGREHDGREEGREGKSARKRRRSKKKRRKEVKRKSYCGHWSPFALDSRWGRYYMATLRRFTREGSPE